jgi:hypothetical protein
MPIFKCCCGCCIDVPADLPTVSISGYTGGEWTSAGSCCMQKVFTPNTPAEFSCCGKLLDKTWTQECLRKAWAFNMPPGIQDTAASCPPSPAVYCFPDPPLIHIGTQTIDYFEHQSLQLKIDWTSPVITVTFGRGTFVCGGVSSCKWFMKIRLTYNVVSAYQSLLSWERTLTTESVHPCFSANTDADGTETFNFPPESSDCESNQWSGCGFTNSSPFFERIKIWNNLPEDGVIVFTNDDTDASCDGLPACAIGDFDETQICIAPQASIDECDPCWQSFAIVDDPTTYTVPAMEIREARGITGCDIDDCFSTIANCNANPTTCPAVSQTLPCEKVVFYGDNESCLCSSDSPSYGCPTEALDASGVLVKCGFYQNTSLTRRFEAIYGTCQGDNCIGTCCHIVGCGPCVQCVPKHIPATWSGVLIGSQELSVSATCSAYNDPPFQPCCINYSPVSLTVEF